LTNDDEAFNQFTYMVASENVPVDFRHSETDMTALMIAAGKGNKEEVQILLQMGADVLMKCHNEYTAMDLAKQLDHLVVGEILQHAMVLVKDRRGVPQPAVQQTQSNGDEFDSRLARIVLDVYQTTTNEDEIDHGLLFDVIKYIHLSMPAGSILIFLPGYDDIIEQNDRLTKNLQNPAGTSHKIFMLHSNMQTKDQKSE
jgi:ATP-dependent RNA helicase YTHDC2